MRRFIGDPLAAVTLIVAAGLIGVAFHGPGLTPLSWMGLVAIALLIRSQYFKLLPALAAGTVLQLAGVDWMRHCYSTPAMNETRLTDWLLLGFAFGAVLPPVLALGVWLRRRQWPLWIIMPVIWTIGDLLRYEGGRLISGGPYPWLTLGLAQTDFIIPCQVADLGGVWAIGFVVAVFAGAVAQAIELRRLPIVPASILCAVAVYGQWRVWSPKFEDGPSTALMPAKSLMVPTADFAVWAETAFYQYQSLPADSVLVQGCYRDDGGKFFNSVAVANGERLIGYYDKCNLVPWSEFTPWVENERELTAGERPGIFECGPFRFGVVVCYDVCFTEFMRDLAKENPQFIAIVANESSDPSMLLAYQLLAQTRLRAIESRRPIVRNANGGYSGIIDGNGQLHSVRVDFREPVVLGPVPLDNRISLYAWLGHWLPTACVLTVLVAFGRDLRLSKRVPNSRHGAPVVEPSQGQGSQQA